MLWFSGSLGIALCAATCPCNPNFAFATPVARYRRRDERHESYSSGSRLILVYGKSTPHFKLSVVKALIAARKVRSTMSALAGGAALWFVFEEMVSVVMALTLADFYKSMTTYADHRIWQDVYRPTTKAGEVYLKLNSH